MSTRTLPRQPDPEQLRRQARELHRAAAAGEPEARQRLSAVDQDVSLHGAQLALAREYGFPSWQRLRFEAERLRLIASGDAAGLAALIETRPELAAEPVTAPDGFGQVPPLHYVGIGLLYGWWEHDRAGELTRVLLGAGVPVDAGTEVEPPLITAASHGEPGMVRALIDAGADLEATGYAAPGSATALAHAVHYGIVGAVDVLVAEGARVHDIVEAAGVGDVGEYLAGASEAERAVALRAAAVCERLGVIDRLLGTGLAVDLEFRTLTEPGGATALHCAAWEGKAGTVAHLLERGADPNRTVPRGDPPRPTTPLDWCRLRAGVGHAAANGSRYAEVEALLAPLTGARTP